MTGFVKIDGKDVFATWGVVFKAGSLYNELLKVPKRKAIYEYNWADENGTDVDFTNVRYESRELSIRIYVIGKNETDFYQKLGAFRNMLLNSTYMMWDIIQMNRRFKLRYTDMSAVTINGIIRGQVDVSCEMTLQLIDDFPTDFLTIPV